MQALELFRLPWRCLKPLSPSLSLPTKRCVSQSYHIDFRLLDAKWQAIWAQRARPSSSSRSKYYVLPMFAYPSGSLHMGHLRVYTISDVLARYRRMKGYNVLHPTGWDAFGLPAENAAIERGINPGEWTVTNIEKMKGQLKSMNTDFNWSAEISTCSPEFYKHTQKLFLMLHKRGLAYEAEALVNYDPIDKTVLANEQVDSNGKSWRSGAVVEQRMLRQWFFRITAFQESLLKDLDVLAEGNKWPDRVLMQQRNWIGLSKGARIQFELKFSEHHSLPINVFTTRPDTLFGVQYIALSLSHPVVRDLATTTPGLEDFLNRRASFGPDSKDGFELPISALHPASKLIPGNAPNLPVFAAPYVLEDYGEGAVMGVPAHDNRDLAFWKRHRPNSTVPIVVSPLGEDIHLVEQRISNFAEAITSHGTLTNLCGKYAGIDSIQGGQQIVKDLALCKAGEETQTWRLRDWLVSRQRYWGTPIPIIHCDTCGPVPVPEQDLPVMLPNLPDSLKGQRGNPLDSIDTFVNVDCPSCGKRAKRETDTMDTFVDSSWYYLRFPDPQNQTEFFSERSASEMLPVDVYVGGVEHAILHLLYARFIYKFLRSEGIVPSAVDQVAEPFTRLISQGMVHGKTFSDPDTGRFLLPHEVQTNTNESAPIVKTTGQEAKVSWEKMSKSKHNGVDPGTCIQKFGADATRAHILFAAPISEILQWDEEKIIGIQRWFQRVSKLVHDLPTSKESDRVLEAVSNADADVLLLAHETLQAVTNTLENNVYSLNTVVSDLIKLTNAISDMGIETLTPWVAQQAVLILIKMMAPVAPAFAEQCYEDIRDITDDGQIHRVSIFDAGWPGHVLSENEASVLQRRKTTTTCAVQVNGKLRFTATVPVQSTASGSIADSKAHEDAVISAVLATNDGQLWLQQRNDWEKRKRVFLVKGGKLLNIVF